MKSRRNHRRRMARFIHAGEIAEHPPQRRARAELERMEKILASLPARTHDEGRPPA